MTHVITGATGNVGSLVVEQLLEAGRRPRVLVRDEQKARARWADRVDVAVGDLEDEASLVAAFAGASAVFAVTSGETLAAQDRRVAAAARAASVGRVVKLSSLDVAHEVGTGVWHARGEAAIRESGVPFVFVRPTGFMSNALYWARSIQQDAVVRSCTGDGRIPFVHPRDIAGVSVAALQRAELVGSVLPLTGPRAMSYAEMGAAIGQAIGRAVSFEELSEAQTRAQQQAWGASPALVEARLSIFRAIRDGRLAEVTGEVERVLGRPPLTFAPWARENAAAFVAPGKP